jgi:hypothetical protein
MDRYGRALQAARKELKKVEELQKTFALRRVQLKQTIDALEALKSNKLPDVNSLSLADGIRMVFSVSKEGHTAPAVKLKLEELGFNLKKFKNPLASIHTAMERMVAADEIAMIELDDETDLDRVGGKGRAKKRFERGERLKKPPNLSQNPGEGNE